jgi:FAD/FMN-containing dehydrogenase
LPQAAKKDKPPPGILVNDVHSQLNSSRVWRIVQPETLDGIRSALRAAQKEEKAVCISGARHAMGGQQFLADGLMIDTRRMNRMLGFDAEKGHVEFEAGIQWPQILAHLANLQKGR